MVSILTAVLICVINLRPDGPLFRLQMTLKIFHEFPVRRYVWVREQWLETDNVSCNLQIYPADMMIL